MNTLKKLPLDISLSVILIFLVSLAYFISSPHDGNFCWSDAPRHALDGVFYLDFFKDLPFKDPIAYAYEYYVHYPALTILFYPPFFAVIEAAFYSIFGISHSTAQLTVSFFVFLTGLGAFQLSRRWLPVGHALSVALLLMGCYELALWGRQVMLDVPAYAFLLWSAVILFQYLDTQSSKLLYILAIVFSLGVYTKLNIIFIFPIYIATIFYKFGWSVIKDRHVWGAGLLFTIIVFPWIVITLKYGQVNMNAALGGQATGELSRHSWEGWLFYIQAVPRQIGVLPSMLALSYVILTAINKQWRLPKTDIFFVFGWILWGYVFFSLIALKEQRHSIFILYPIVLLSILIIYKIFNHRKFSCLISIAVALFYLIDSLFFKQTPYIDGYKEAANFTAQYAPPHSAVLFSGYRDGSFIYNMRTHSERSDLTILRADKFLLKVAVKREMGIKEKILTEQGIREWINKSGVHYIVNQPNFWDDLNVMQKFQNVLESAQFEKIKTIYIQGNINHKDKKLIIYKNTGVVEKVPELITIELPIIGIKIKGKTSHP